MTTTTHTPGPWKAVDDSINTADGLRVIGRAAGDTDAEAEANARLIASAPDLLAALERIYRINKHQDYSYDQREQMIDDQARTAIAKATQGGSK